MIDRALVQRDPDTGAPINVNVYNAWYGLDRMGIETVPFTWPELAAGKVALSRATLVVGGIAPIRAALVQLGVEPPANIDYPPALAGFLGRTVRQATIREAHALCVDDRFTPPVFIKPVTGHKEFTGQVLATYRDRLATARLAAQAPDTAVWISEVVALVSEWRYFVHDGEIVGTGHYHGDPLRTPDPALVRRAVEQYQASGEAPVAHAMDFGVLAGGATVLVEVNDGFAFGAYGLRPDLHVRMLIARWREMLGR